MAKQSKISPSSSGVLARRALKGEGLAGETPGSGASAGRLPAERTLIRRILVGLFLVALVPTGFFALAWQERLARVFRQARALGRLAREPGLRERLRAEKEALLAELAAFAELPTERSAP